MKNKQYRKLCQLVKRMAAGDETFDRKPIEKLELLCKSEKLTTLLNLWRNTGIDSVNMFQVQNLCIIEWRKGII